MPRSWQLLAPNERRLGGSKDGWIMEPEIIHLDGFRVMGIVLRFKSGSESPEQFAAIWSKFESRHGEIAPYSTGLRFYGMSFGPDEQGMIDYLAGMAVEDVERVPEGLVVRDIPGADYAAFACRIQSIGEAYHQIFGEWLPKSGYRLNESVPSFEKYPPAGDDQSPVLIHIPVLVAGR
jgi:predicted transcriptional regulator YdeE